MARVGISGSFHGGDDGQLVIVGLLEESIKTFVTQEDVFLWGNAT